MQHVKDFDAKLALPFRDRRANDVVVFANEWPPLHVDHFHSSILIGDHEIGWPRPGDAVEYAPSLLDQPSASPRFGYSAETVPVVPIVQER